jgi:hypothetical protein
MLTFVSEHDSQIFQRLWTTFLCVAARRWNFGGEGGGQSSRGVGEGGIELPASHVDCLPP